MKIACRRKLAANLIGNEILSDSKKNPKDEN